MKRSLLCLLFTLQQAVAAAPPREITLTTLEWPPYTGGQLPGQGLNSEVIRTAFQAMGYRVTFRIVPWQRAVAEARFNPKVAGYFPEYDSAEGRKAFIFSDPIGSSPLGFAERMDERIRWQALSELSRRRIGVVQGYVNTAELDQRIADKRQNVDEAPDDTQNLLKLDRRHIDLAVIDSNVFNYLMQNEPRLKSTRGRLIMNPHLLDEKKLFVCFKPSAEGKQLADVLNQGLKKINLKLVILRYLQGLDHPEPPVQSAANIKKPVG